MAIKDPRGDKPGDLGAVGGTGGAPPPPPPPPAPKKKGGSSTGAAFNAFINAHPTMRGYADQIWRWSKVYGTDPVVMAGLYWRESFAAAKAAGKDPASIVSPAGAVGIGQIMPLHVGEKTPWGHIVTQTDLVNPAFNIRWSTWYFSKQQEKYGTPDAAYSKGYNPGYTGPALTSLLPKGYVPRGGLNPNESASVSVERTNATKTLTDPWAVLTAKGKLAYVNAPNPPNGTVQSFGQPLRKSDFLRAVSHYQDIFTAYTGRPGNAKQIAGVLSKGLSDYALQTALSKTPQFTRSRVWAAAAPSIIGYAKGILGDNWKVDKNLVRQAIVQNWSEGTLAEKIRQLPAYLQGPKYKQEVAALTSVHQTIMGNPNPGELTAIKEAALGGWSADQYAAWLRAQPTYKSSPEFQSKTLSVLDALGLVFGGAQAVLKPGVKPLPTGQPNTAGALPNSPRIAGKGSETPNNDLAATYG